MTAFSEQFSLFLQPLLQQRYFFIFVAILCLLIPIPTLIDVLCLRPDQGLLQNGQIWRLITGHLVHASWSHLSVNIINLILLRLIFSQWLDIKLFSILIIVNTIAISIGMIFSTVLDYYVGFSGLFYSLLIYLLLSYWSSQRFIFSLAIACVVGKVAYENLIGTSEDLSHFIQIAIASDAHAWGLLSGAVCWLTQRYLMTLFPQKNPPIDTDTK